MSQKCEKIYHTYKKYPSILCPGILGINHKSIKLLIKVGTVTRNGESGGKTGLQKWEKTCRIQIVKMNMRLIGICRIAKDDARP